MVLPRGVCTSKDALWNIPPSLSHADNFLGSQGVIKMDFTDKGLRINSIYYSSLVKETRGLRRKPRGTPLWLLQDNAPVHTSGLSMETIADSQFTLIAHPPYSPDLAPSDFWMFRHLKKSLRGKIFESAQDVQEDVKKFLGEQPRKFFETAFSELLTRWEKCVTNGGSYIEK
jgi:[histone H3]-lysine36 N-dimethyltransferase SETMAR